MRQNEKVIFGIITLLMASFFSGCKLVRDVDIGKVNIATPTPTKEVEAPNNPIVTMQPTQNPVTIVVEDGPLLSEKEIFDFFYGEDKETIAEEGYMEEYWYDEHLIGYRCDKGGIVLNYTYAYDLYAGDSRSYFMLKDMTEGASLSYEPMCQFSARGSQAFFEDYPEIDLEICTREEAIAACAPLAELCGYGDAQVKAYAITEEFLLEYTEYWKDMGYRYSAPKPDYEYVSQRDIDIAIEAGDDLLANKLKYKKSYERCKYVKWSKEHEAYILVYNSVLNGRVLADNSYDMYCVYVPKYEKIIYALVKQSLVAVKGLEEVKLMTEEEAIAKALRILKIEFPEDITIKGMSLVYDAEYEKVNVDIEEWMIDPCWKIDYVLSEKLMQQPIYEQYDGTIVLNAISGEEV